MPDAPSRVRDASAHWGEAPPERSPRCAYWVRRIEAGWRPNARIRNEGYEGATHFYGVWLWEYLHVIAPLLERLCTTSPRKDTDDAGR